jgi:hypothetical protein
MKSRLNRRRMDLSFAMNARCAAHRASEGLPSGIDVEEG